MNSFGYKLGYLVSHPIQYQAPLLRRIAETPNIDLTVLFETLATAERHHDKGFRREFEWDTPLIEGYSHHAVSNPAELQGWLAKSDVLWVHGWDSALRRKALTMAVASGLPTLMRGENTLAAMPDGAGLRGMAKRHYLKRIFRHCVGFLCIGTDNRRYYETHGIGEERLFSMPYAVDNDFFQAQARDASSRRNKFRSELRLKPDRPIILFAGKLQERKHPLTLLKAWRQLDHEKTGRPYLLYVGDGEERAALEAMSQDDDSIRILGFRNQSELPAFYDLANVFILASEREPWGLSVNEAMACGTAVIVSNQCGCAVDLVDKSVGAIIPAGDASTLAKTIAFILSEPELSKSMGKAARKRITNWSFDQDIEGLEGALKAVCPTPRQA